METFAIIAGFLILLILNSRWNIRFEILSEKLNVLSMATDRLEHELGTAKKGERKVNEYLASKLGPKHQNISIEADDSSLLGQLEILLAAQADIHRCVTKFANPEIWQGGVPLTRGYDQDNFDEIGFYNDADPKSNFFKKRTNFKSSPVRVSAQPIYSSTIGIAF